MEELEAGLNLAVGLVGVGLQLDRGVGEIGRLWFVADVEHPAEVVAGDVADVVRNLGDGAFGRWRVANDDEAVPGEVAKEVDSGLGDAGFVEASGDRRPGDGGKRSRSGFPGDGRGRRLRIGDPAEPLHERSDRQLAPMAVGKGHGERVAVEFGVDGHQPGLDIERGEQALAVGRLDLARLGRLFPQPLGVEAGRSVAEAGLDVAIGGHGSRR